VSRASGDEGFDRCASGLIVHAHPHTHYHLEHRHLHVHPRDHDHEDPAIHREHVLPGSMQRSPRSLATSFSVGLVHGLAGSAAIALLVLSAIPEPQFALVYLAIFCVGTIIGMALITTAIATPFMLASQRLSWLHQGLVTGSGLLSFGFGIFLVYEIGIIDLLLGATR